MAEMGLKSPIKPAFSTVIRMDFSVCFYFQQVHCLPFFFMNTILKSFLFNFLPPRTSLPHLWYFFFCKGNSPWHARSWWLKRTVKKGGGRRDAGNQISRATYLTRQLDYQRFQFCNLTDPYWKQPIWFDFRKSECDQTSDCKLVNNGCRCRVLAWMLH